MKRLAEEVVHYDYGDFVTLQKFANLPKQPEWRSDPVGLLKKFIKGITVFHTDEFEEMLYLTANTQDEYISGTVAATLNLQYYIGQQGTPCFHDESLLYIVRCSQECDTSWAGSCLSFLTWVTHNTHVDRSLALDMLAVLMVLGDIVARTSYAIVNQLDEEIRSNGDSDSVHLPPDLAGTTRQAKWNASIQILKQHLADAQLNIEKHLRI